MERRLSLGAILVGASGYPLRAAGRVATPRLTLGPYYTPEIPGDHDWDLVRSAARTASGQVLQVEGQILLASGRPVAGATIETWQVDANGRYLPPARRSAPGRGIPDSRATARPSPTRAAATATARCVRRATRCRGAGAAAGARPTSISA